MTCNPILSYELRARWRMGRSFLLVLGVALALSFLAWFVYQSASVRSGDEVSGAGLSQAQNVAARSSIVGRDLFVALAGGNSLIWLFLAGALAASGVARERERGLLESLQLSRMTARSQISARLAANGLLLLVLQTATLPIYGVAFLMGGISPGEIGAALYVVVWAALLGSALGLAFSARAHRPTGALMGTLGTLFLLTLAAYSAYADFSSLRRFPLAAPNAWEALIFSHPTALFARLLSPTTKFYFDTRQILAIDTLLWTLLTALLLWDATRWVGKTLPAPLWQTRAPWLEKWRREHLERAQNRKEAAKNRASEKMQGALLADLPLERFVHFRDPLLSREVRSRFRLRRAGFWIGAVRFALFLIAAGIWLFGIFWLFDPPSRSGMAPYGLRALLYGGVGTLATLAATSFTRERESGTWEGLKLSLMTPREVLLAKWRSPLVSFAYYSAPLWILLPIGACFINPLSFALGFVVVATWLGLAVALGLWVSWRAKNSTAAIAWTAGILLSLLVVAPWLNGVAHVDDSLARWRYGVGGIGRGYYDSELYDANGNLRPSLIARYKAETGDKSVYLLSSRYGSYFRSRDGSIEGWIGSQQIKAAAFEALLWAWHPGESLNAIFSDIDRKIDPNSMYGRRNFDLSPVMICSSIAAPLVLSILLLALLQRDVRREQLNA